MTVLSNSLSVFKLTCRAPEYFQSAYLLADLGGGGDRWVWLATTPNGKVYVLKFSLDKQMLDLECENETSCGHQQRFL